MSTVALANPGALQAALITGGKLGTSGTDVYVKVMRYSIPWQFDLMRTTGDGDITNTHSWEISYMVDFGITIDGLMVASSANGFLLNNLIDTTKNPITTDHKLFFASGQVLNLPKTLIYGGVLSGERDAPAVRVVYRMKATDEKPTWSAS